jgi:hypothetical protein
VVSSVLVSAEKCGQEVKEVTLCFEKDSSCRLVNPWDCAKIDGDDRIFCDREIELHAAAGETIILQKYSMS